MAEAGEPAGPGRVSARVLVAEDEALIALDLERTLRSFGCEVLGPTASIAATLELLGQERPDAVLLDVDLVDGLAVPVAETLAALQVPFALVTGHHASPLDHSALYAVPRLEKPYAESELRRTLGQLIGR
jgi:two-component SAPR family response regulator